jgi:hypothetical protein
MARVGKSRVTRIVSLLCGLAVLGSLVGCVTVAEAGPLEGATGAVGEVTRSVEEVTSGALTQVEEVTEAAPPPVAEVTEAVVPPAKAAVETVTPPVHEAVEAVTPPAKEAIETVTQAAQGATGRVPSPAVTTPVEAPASAGGPGRTATHAVEEAVGTVTGATPGGHATVPEDSTGASAPPASPSPSPSSSGSTATTPSHADRSRDDSFRGNSTDGAVRAPLPKWMAYVWPAVALLPPEITEALKRWGQESADLLLAAAHGPTGSIGVAGVHASHDAGAAESGSSSSPLSGIPSAVDGFTSHVPGEALAYLLVVALLIAAVFGAVKYELARRDRDPG